MKFGHAKLNFAIKMSKESIKQIDKMLHRMEKAVTKPLLALKKMFSMRNIVKKGGKAAGSMLGEVAHLVTDQVMESVDTLNKTIEMNNRLVDRGRSLGITATKQQGLDEYLGALNLGGRIGESIQASFASALESGQLTDLIKAGKIKGADAAEKFQSFMAHMANMNEQKQSDFLIKKGFSIQETNAIFQSRRDMGEKKYAKLVTAPVQNGNDELNKRAHHYNKLVQESEIHKSGMALNNGDHLKKFEEIKGLEEKDLQVKMNGITEKNLQVIITALKMKNGGNKILSEGTSMIGGFLNNLANKFDKHSNRQAQHRKGYRE